MRRPIYSPCWCDNVDRKIDLNLAYHSIAAMKMVKTERKRSISWGLSLDHPHRRHPEIGGGPSTVRAPTFLDPHLPSGMSVVDVRCFVVDRMAALSVRNSWFKFFTVILRGERIGNDRLTQTAKMNGYLRFVCGDR